jgi:acyl carrier protein
MQKELQTLKEKLKDIQSQVGAALTIIDEAEQVFSRLRLEGGKLSEEKSSFLEFIKNEVSPNKEEDKARILEFVKSHKASGCSESHFSAVATYLFNPGDHDYVESLLKEMVENRQIVYCDEYISINEERVASCDGGSIVDAADGQLIHQICNAAASDISNSTDSSFKRLTSEDILKYLQKKAQGATLKQIQSRFKGYSKSSCLDIFNTCIHDDRLFVEDNVHLSKAQVEVKSNLKEIQPFIRVRSVLVDVLGVDERLVESSSRIVEDFGADSLDITETIMAIEEEFDIAVPDEDAEKINTVGDIVQHLEWKLSGGK